MSFGFFRSPACRAALAVAAVQVVLLAQAAHAWGQDRRAAPITFAAAPTAPGASGAGAAGGGETVTWRYPDQPDVVYSAEGATRSAEAAPTVVLDLRRSAGGSPAPAAATTPAPPAPTSRPAWLEEERVGSPYQEAGVWYTPTPEPGFAEEGALAVYPPASGAVTASGEAFDPNALTAAHPTLPIPSLIQVTDLATGREVIVRLNDRGPFNPARLVALSPAAARALGADDGAQVFVRYLGPAPTRVRDSAAPPGFAQTTYVPSGYAGAPLIEEGPIDPTTPIADLPLPPNVGAGAGVVAPSASPAPAVRGGFAVQLGAFADLQNAYDLRAQVRTLGVVSIEPVSTPRGELYRVRLGPYASEGEAETARAAAARLGAAGGVVRPLS